MLLLQNRKISPARKFSLSARLARPALFFPHPMLIGGKHRVRISEKQGGTPCPLGSSPFRKSIFHRPRLFSTTPDVDRQQTSDVYILVFASFT